MLHGDEEFRLLFCSASVNNRLCLSSVSIDCYRLFSRKYVIYLVAIYIHCNGHVLNLCLIDVATAVAPIRQNFGVIQALYKLIEGSAKRHHVFEDVQKQAGLKPLVLKPLCETRWTCRSECLKVILARYSEVVTALGTLDNGDGLLMLNTIKTFDFLFHLLIMNEIYLITTILSKYLQGSNISLTSALIQVRLTIETLKRFRTELKFEEFWSKTLSICESNDIDEPKENRKRKTPAKLGGGSVTPNTFSIKDSYRVNSFYAVLDQITMAIDNRFDENNVSVVVLCKKLFPRLKGGSYKIKVCLFVCLSVCLSPGQKNVAGKESDCE